MAQVPSAVVPSAMAATPGQPDKPAAAATKPAKARRPRVDWKTVWPLPLAVGAAGLLVTGIVAGVWKMPKDDPEIPLSRIRGLVQESRYLDAVSQINADLVPLYNRGIMSPKQQKEFFQLRGRALLYGQQALGVQQEVNYKRIIEAFETGRNIGLQLEAGDIFGLGQAYLFTGEVDKAVRMARALATLDDDRRLRLYRQVVEEVLTPKAGVVGGRLPEDTRLALELLAEMIEMPDLPLSDRAWIVARQAELRIAGGFYDEAAVRLMRDINKFDSLSTEARAELLFLLGKAYYLSGRPDEAIDFLETAERDLPGFDERRGESAVMRAQIQQGWGRNEEAREIFGAVAAGFRESPTQAPALLGLAETQAALGETKAALDAFREVTELVRSRQGERKSTGGVTLGDITQRLLSRSQERLLQGEPAEAIAYALRAEDAIRAASASAGDKDDSPGEASSRAADANSTLGGGTPAAVHLQLAVASRAAADRILAEAGVGPTGRPDWSQVSPVSATEVKGLLIDAGSAYRQHARLITASDFNLMMDSVWNAADSFDRAGDSDAAIEAFTTFLQGAQPGLPRRSEATWRLAQVFESRGEYDLAARLYDQLLSQRNNAQNTAGVWADRSIVPLARCLIESTSPDPLRAAEEAAEGAAANAGRPATAAGAAAPVETRPAADRAATQEASDRNQRRATELLRSVIDGGRLVEPDAREFREALALLGELHYRRGEFEQAIPRLRDAIERDPDGPRVAMLRYKMADAHRQRALELTSLGADEPLSERRLRASERAEHLREAERLYRLVASEIGRKPAARVGPVEQLLRRNSIFYAADAVYLAGNYPEAVRHYLAARDQYPNDPSSMMALVQTVAALVRLERWDEAKAVHERARTLLASLPDTVWNDPSRLLPMERRHWEAWLDSRLQLERYVARSSQPAAPAPDVNPESATANAPTEGEQQP